MIARYRLKNDSLTVVFRDTIESCCHLFCLLCCYPTLSYSLHGFLGGNLLAGDFLLFGFVILGGRKGFGSAVELQFECGMNTSDGDDVALFT